ncbi:MAG TPA: O-antigen ligase family protein [Stellaceae bacterium]|nr:O-antigen ligase family protein [Stellaceae bacterium]
MIGAERRDGDVWWRGWLRRPRPRRRLALAGGPAVAAPPALDVVRRWGFIAVLAWAPLPLGSDRPWSWSLLGLLVALLLALSAALSARAGAERLSLRPLRVPLLLGAVLALWILCQNLDLLGAHHPLWDKASEVLGRKLAASISVDREASRIRLFRLLTDAGGFFLAWQIARQAEGAALLVKSIAVIGAAYALYGMVEFASADPSILWMPKWAYVHDVTSTFVNRNSFATFAGLTTLAGLTLVARALFRHVDPRSVRTLLASILDTLLWRGSWPVIAVVLTGPAVLLSHSRAGALATLCGVLTLGVAVAAAPSLKHPARRLFIGFLGAGCLLGLVVAGAATLDRVVDTTQGEEDARAFILQDTLPAVADNWLAGTGLGTFRFIYPMYQTTEIEGIVDLAHDDYLENILELGVPGALLLFALVAWLAGQCGLGVIRRRRDALYPCLGLAASVLVAVHSMFDFSLQMPAIAVLYAALLGIGVAQSLRSHPAPDARVAVAAEREEIINQDRPFSSRDAAGRR